MRRLLFFALLFPSLSGADIYLEPSVGYVLGKYKGSVTVASPALFAGEEIPLKQDAKGLGYGAKLGWTNDFLAVGVDVALASTTGKEDGSPDTKYNSTDMGVFAQLDLPVLPFKFAATYVLSSRVKTKQSGNDDAEMTGKGLKIGAGFTGLPFLSINLDYVMSNYDDYKTEGWEFSKKDIDYTATILSVSLPLSL